MSFAGLAIREACVILPPKKLGDRKIFKGITGGESRTNVGKAEQLKREEVPGKESSPRGEGGEGRVRNW
jgi:hypothetical protein